MPKGTQGWRTYPDRSQCLQASCPILPTHHAHQAGRGTPKPWDILACGLHMGKKPGRVVSLSMRAQGSTR
jgi:hypothetical protein